MAQPEKEYCQGPGNKLIFATKADAQDELRHFRRGRIACIGQGSAYRCKWGDHYHITKSKNPKRSR